MHIAYIYYNSYLLYVPWLTIHRHRHPYNEVVMVETLSWHLLHIMSCTHFILCCNVIMYIILYIYVYVCMYDRGEVHVCYNSTESQPKSIISACSVPKNSYPIWPHDLMMSLVALTAWSDRTVWCCEMILRQQWCLQYAMCHVPYLLFSEASQGTTTCQTTQSSNSQWLEEGNSSTEVITQARENRAQQKCKGTFVWISMVGITYKN